MKKLFYLTLICLFLITISFPVMSNTETENKQFHNVPFPGANTENTKTPPPAEIGETVTPASNTLAQSFPFPNGINIPTPPDINGMPDPMNILNIINSIMSNFGAGDYDTTISTLLNTISKDPNSIDSHLFLGHAYNETGKIDSAIEQYKRVIELNPTSYSALYNMADLLNIKGDYRNAIYYYGQAGQNAKTEIEKGNSNFYMGNCYLQTKDYKKAIECYEKTLIEMPNETITYYNLGQSYYGLKDNKKALQYYKKYVEVAPDGDYAKTARSNIAFLEKGNDGKPPSAEDHYKLGLGYENKKDYDSAKDEYEKALELKAEYLEVMDKLGGLYLNIYKDYDKSAFYYQGILEKKKDYGPAYYNLAVVYHKQERYKDAVEYYKKYIEIDPNGSYVSQAKNSLAELDKAAQTPVVEPTPVEAAKKDPIIDIIEPELLVGKKNLTLEVTNPAVTNVRIAGLVSYDEKIKQLTVNGQPVELSIPSAKCLELGRNDGYAYKSQFTANVGLTTGKNIIKVKIIDNSGKNIEKEVAVNYNPENGPPAQPDPIQKGEKWAVIIGIGNYQNQKINKLNYTVADAQAIYKFLTTKGGFPADHVKLILNENATAKNIKSSLGTFLSRKALKNDTVFVYYSGHGAPEPDSASPDGDGMSKYLVTYDADPDDLYSTAFAMDEIKNVFQKIEAGRIVFFIDACYSGASGGKTFSKPGLKAGNVSDKFLENISGEGRLIITASGANEVSMEVPELGHGIFTYYLLKGLEGEADINKNKKVTIDDLYDYLFDKVVRESKSRGGNQHPIKKGESSGKIVLVSY